MGYWTPWGSPPMGTWELHVYLENNDNVYVKLYFL
jgi:hypothetical protein